MLEKNAITATPIHDLLNRRWSPRAFDKSKAVSRAQINALIEAARWAPSCNGDEPWRYLVWNRADDATGWQKAFECLGEGNRKWCENVPVLMLSCAGSVFSHNGKPNRYTQHDTGMASVSLSLQAVALGLAAHVQPQAEGLDPQVGLRQQPVRRAGEQLEFQFVHRQRLAAPLDGADVQRQFDAGPLGLDLAAEQIGRAHV